MGGDDIGVPIELGELNSTEDAGGDGVVIGVPELPPLRGRGDKGAGIDGAGLPEPLACEASGTFSCNSCEGGAAFVVKLRGPLFCLVLGLNPP